VAGVFQRFASFFFLLTVFFIPYFVSHGDIVLSHWAVSHCGFHEANPIGLVSPYAVMFLDFIVGAVGVVGFLSMASHPRFAFVLLLVWSVYVFVFGLALHHNILLVAWGCSHG